MNDNLKYWNSLNRPPRSALKEITAGRLKGKSDINPQWRYMAMTELFGPVGIGWKYTIDSTWTTPASKDEVMVFAQVSVSVCVEGAWSQPVPGIGGSTLIASEKGGLYNNDEAYKMAITDALSVAMKMFGVAADIYMGLWDGAKYKDADAPGKTEPVKQERTEEEKKKLSQDAWARLIVEAKACGVGYEPLNPKMTSEEMKAAYLELAGRIKAKKSAHTEPAGPDVGDGENM